MTNDLQPMSKSAISVDRSFFSNPTYNAAASQAPDFMSPISDRKIETHTSFFPDNNNPLKGKKLDNLQSAIYNRQNFTLNSNYNREHQAKRSEDGLSIYKPKNSLGVKNREQIHDVSYMPQKRPNTQSMTVAHRS